MSNFTLCIKPQERKTMTNEEMAKRREYGSLAYRGRKYENPETGKVEENVNIGYINILPVHYEKVYDQTRNYLVWEYKTFLEDYFYRKYRGYSLPKWYKEPEDPREIEFYNQIAYESGHPEYIINTQKNSEIRLIEAKENSGKVDILDKDGNVIVSSDKSTEEKEKTDEEVKSEEEKPADESEKAEENATAEKSENADNKSDKDTTEAKQPKSEKSQESNTSHLKDAVVFKEVGPTGECWVEEERFNEFEQTNKSIIESFPGLQRVVDICRRSNRAIKFYLDRGLVRGDIYTKGVISPAGVIYIDPGKIKPGYSMLYGARTGMGSEIFDMTFISFEEPFFEEMIATNIVKPEWIMAARGKMINHQFFKHIAYNAVPDEDLAIAAANTYYLCTAMDNANCDARFKVIKYDSTDHFVLLCDAKVGLGKYIKSNAKFNGMKIDVCLKDGVVTNTASGNGAEEFVAMVGDVCGLASADDAGDVDVSQIVKDAVKRAQQEQPKPKKGKGKKIEVPSGRK